MSQPLYPGSAKPEGLNPTSAIAERTHALADSIASALESTSNFEQKKEMLDQLINTAINDIRALTQPAILKSLKCEVPPEVIEQALRDFNEQETLDELRQTQEAGGFELSDFYENLERLARE